MEYTPGRRIAVLDVGGDGYPIGAAKLGEVVDVREDGRLLVQFDATSGWSVVDKQTSHVVAMRGADTDPYSVVGEVVDDEDGQVIVRFDRMPLSARSEGTVELVPIASRAFERHVARKSMFVAISNIVDEDTRQLLARVMPGVAAEVEEDRRLEEAVSIETSG